MKDYIGYNIKNINNEEKQINKMNELLDILKGTNFDMENLFDVIKEGI